MKAIINIQEYQKNTDIDKPILSDFHADWCGPYIALFPKLRLKHKVDLIVRKINSNKSPTQFTRA